MTEFTYKLIDSANNSQLGADYKGRAGRKRANNKADKLNNVHGSYRYTVKTIFK